MPSSIQNTQLATIPQSQLPPQHEGQNQLRHEIGPSLTPGGHPARQTSRVPTLHRFLSLMGLEAFCGLKHSRQRDRRNSETQSLLESGGSTPRSSYEFDRSTPSHIQYTSTLQPDIDLEESPPKSSRTDVSDGFEFVRLAALNAGLKLKNRFIIDLPALDPGICLREGTKWGACRIVGAPFKYSGMKVDKAYGKHAEYAKAAKAAPFIDDDKLNQKANDSIAMQFMQKWASKFTDADKGVHVGKVEIDEILHCSLTERFPDGRIEDDQVVALFLLAPGNPPFAHMMIVAGGEGGDPPVLFDPAVGELEFTDSDHVQAIERYANAIHSGSGFVGGEIASAGFFPI